MLKAFSPLRFSGLALLGATLLAAVAASADQAVTATRDYAPSEATGDILPKYKAAADAKNYDGAIAILDAQLPKVPADSYDAALIYQLKMQTLMQKGEFLKAIAPMEKTLELSDSHTPHYFEDRVTRELLYYLTQLYFQEAIQAKGENAILAYYEKADKVFQRWLKLTPKSNPDAQLMYAQLLYSMATVNQEKPDLEIVKRALEQTEIGLHLAIHPKETFYVIKYVCLQQLNRNADAADLLEQIVKLKPDSSSYWQQLVALYISTNQDLRAIVTFERAQANGLMNAPKDNYNLVGLYFNLGQYEKASELLEAGLNSGKIDNDPKNWELLALTYQQLQRPYKAIDALKQATKAFPDSGQLEFQVAQSYHTLEKSEEALTHLQAAVAKGNLTKPSQVYLFLAYIAYDLKKFDVALEAAKKAAALPDSGKEAKGMIRAIEDAIKEREAKKSKM